MNEEPPPKDYVEGLIDLFCVAGGFALMGYLKVHYGSELGDWILSLVGY